MSSFDANEKLSQFSQVPVSRDARLTDAGERAGLARDRKHIVRTSPVVPQLPSISRLHSEEETEGVRTRNRPRFQG